MPQFVAYIMSPTFQIRISPELFAVLTVLVEQRREKTGNKRLTVGDEVELQLKEHLGLSYLKIAAPKVKHGKSTNQN